MSQHGGIQGRIQILWYIILVFLYLLHCSLFILYIDHDRFYNFGYSLIRYYSICAQLLCVYYLGSYIHTKLDQSRADCPHGNFQSGLLLTGFNLILDSSYEICYLATSWPPPPSNESIILLSIGVFLIIRNGVKLKFNLQ